MKKLLLFIIPAVFGVGQISQGQVQTNRFSVNTQSGFLYFDAGDGNEDTTVEGSQYIVNQYLPAKISCYDGLVPPVRYNAFKDEMEFTQDGKMYYISKTDSCEVAISGKNYRYVNYTQANKLTKGYLVVLTNGDKTKYALYKQEKVTFVPGSAASSSYHESKPARYDVEKTKYFFGKQDGINEMPTKKKDILALFPEQKGKIEAYFKENNVSFSTEADLIKLVNFLNTL